MGYQALLFCPDDKTARTVTQVLSELDFTVEACTEPFAAVKKLMGQHFDAVVVDCDNELNATLLFKSARNSTSNQTSLAVAVVEGQAGVAKAFRIGANLVLTKPINIEQSKGTLRVARGLLRKSDPTKPGSTTGTFAVPSAPTGISATPTAATAAPTAAAAAPAPVKPAAPKPAATVKPAGPAAPKPVAPAATATFKPPQAPAAKPAAPAAWPAPAAQAKSAPAAQDAPPVAPVLQKTIAPAVPAAPPALYNATLATPAPLRPIAPPAPAQAKPPIVSSPVSSGAASAPAPALEPQVPKAEEKPAHSAEALFEKPAEAAASEAPAYVGAAPSFTFGGSTAEREPSGGGGKRALIGVAAVALVAVGGYFGYSHFKGGSNLSPQPTASSAPAGPSAAPKGVSAPAASPIVDTAKPSAASQPDITLTTAANSPTEESTPSTSTPSPRPSVTKPASTSSSPVSSAVSETPVTTDEPEKPALVVKGGQSPVVPAKATPVPDAPAPSLIGMGAPPDGELPNLGASTSSVKPLLQTLSVSQGVSQGLLYKKVSPSYPMNALRMHIQGTVELQATISKTGDITHIKVVSGDPQLTRAASDAVKQWKYKPYLLNGEPVEIQTGVTVNFKLPH